MVETSQGFPGASEGECPTTHIAERDWWQDFGNRFGWWLYGWSDRASATFVFAGERFQISGAVRASIERALAADSLPIIERAVGDFLEEVDVEVERAKERWKQVDQTNSVNDYIAYALAYIGRATSARRNNGEDKIVMLVKGAGLLAIAAEKLSRDNR